MRVCIFTRVFRQKVEVRCLFYFYFQVSFLISFHLIYLGRNSCLNPEISNFKLVLRVLSQPLSTKITSRLFIHTCCICGVGD